MATNYPGALDSFTNPSAGDALDSPSHAGQHADANDAIEAVQTELGTDPAGGSATVKARFEAIEANDWVTSARIAADAVGSSEIAANAVGSSELADNAVDAAAIATGAVTAAKILIGAATVGSGTGVPEGVVTAAPGSTWLQTDSTTDVKGWIKWVKATGTGNTGWKAGPEADTGWRVIAYTAGDANWTEGNIYVRRVGTVVHVSLLDVKMAAISTKIITLPAGFVNQVSAAVAAVVRESAVTGNPYWFAISNGQVCRYGYALTGTFQNTYKFNGTFTFVTADAWPSSLPGSAV